MDGARVTLIALLLAGCAHEAPISHRPQVSETPYSALKIYEQGRKDALDDLRSNPVWEKPIYSCEDKVSWVDPDLGMPSWASRDENMRLLDVCRKNANYNGGLAAEQRTSVKKAR